MKDAYYILLPFRVAKCRTLQPQWFCGSSKYETILADRSSEMQFFLCPPTTRRRDFYVVPYQFVLLISDKLFISGKFTIKTFVARNNWHCQITENNSKWSRSLFRCYTIHIKIRSFRCNVPAFIGTHTYTYMHAHARTRTLKSAHVHRTHTHERTPHKY